MGKRAEGDNITIIIIIIIVILTYYYNFFFFLFFHIRTSGSRSCIRHNYLIDSSVNLGPAGICKFNLLFEIVSGNGSAFLDFFKLIYLFIYLLFFLSVLI